MLDAMLDGLKRKRRAAWNRNIAEVPPIVQEPLVWLETHGGLNTQGLFRVTGPLAEVRKCKAMYEKGKPVDFQRDARNDPHAVAGIVKLFLQDLEDPLLTAELYAAWIESVVTADEVELQVSCLRRITNLLPPGNKAIFLRLLQFCSTLVKNESQTKMTPNNLAIVFAPSLLRPKSNDPITILNDGPKAQRVLELCIKRYDDLTTKKPAASTDADKAKLARFEKTLKVGTIKLARSLVEEQKKMLEEEENAAPNAGGEWPLRPRGGTGPPAADAAAKWDSVFASTNYNPAEAGTSPAKGTGASPRHVQLEKPLPALPKDASPRRREPEKAKAEREERVVSEQREKSRTNERDRDSKDNKLDSKDRERDREREKERERRHARVAARAERKGEQRDKEDKERRERLKARQREREKRRSGGHDKVDKALLNRPTKEAPSPFRKEGLSTSDGRPTSPEKGDKDKTKADKAQSPRSKEKEAAEAKKDSTTKETKPEKPADDDSDEVIIAPPPLNRVSSLGRVSKSAAVPPPLKKGGSQSEADLIATTVTAPAKPPPLVKGASADNVPALSLSAPGAEHSTAVDDESSSEVSDDTEEHDKSEEDEQLPPTPAAAEDVSPSTLRRQRSLSEASGGKPTRYSLLSALPTGSVIRETARRANAPPGTEHRRLSRVETVMEMLVAPSSPHESPPVPPKALSDLVDGILTEGIEDMSSMLEAMSLDEVAQLEGALTAAVKSPDAAGGDDDWEWSESDTNSNK